MNRSLYIDKNEKYNIRGLRQYASNNFQILVSCYARNDGKLYPFCFLFQGIIHEHNFTSI